MVLFQIYDITTGVRLLRLYDADKANNYKANRAIFNPTDDLVLNDGVLWDVRAAKAVHKFDKFNQYVSGVFHPVGLEIIINSEVVSLDNYWLRSWEMGPFLYMYKQCANKYIKIGIILTC